VQDKRHKITDYHKQQNHNLNIRHPVNIKSGDPGLNSTGKIAMVKKKLADMPYSRGHTSRQFNLMGEMWLSQRCC
jgi:hypothetical protein